MTTTMNMPKSEILTTPERRRRWSATEKLAMVAETSEPGMSVSLVARRHGVAPSQLFAWRRLANQGGADGHPGRRESGSRIRIPFPAKPNP